MYVNLASVVHGASVECERQHVGLDRVVFLLVGYAVACNWKRDTFALADLENIAAAVEPSNEGRYRGHPVRFANGGPSSNARDISVHMVRLFSMLDESTDPTEFVKAFELIHPYSDGNGRLGWILYNFLNGTMDDPQPLPDMFS